MTPTDPTAIWYCFSTSSTLFSQPWRGRGRGEEETEVEGGRRREGRRGTEEEEMEEEEETEVEGGRRREGRRRKRRK